MKFLSKADLGALDSQHIFLHLSGAASRIPEEPWEFSMRCCEKNATIQKILMVEHLVENCLLQVFFVPAERPQHNSQRRELTQTGQSIWMGFHSRFFLNSLPSSFHPEVKVESFLRQRMPWALSTLANTLSTKLGVFFLSHFRKFNCSKALFNQLVHTYSWAQALRKLFQPSL